MLPIKITYKGEDYELEFTRKSADALARRGFDLDKIDTMALTMVPMLFHGAFMAHHPKVRLEFSNEIYSHLTNRAELLRVLAEMYAEPTRALIEEPDEEEGNVSWTRG